MTLPAKKALLGAVFLAALLLASRQASACETDADCKSGRVCRNTVCTSPAPIEPKPQACVREKDCPGDQACTAGFCSASATAPGTASAPTPAPGPAATPPHDAPAATPSHEAPGEVPPTVDATPAPPEQPKRAIIEQRPQPTAPTPAPTVRADPAPSPAVERSRSDFGVEIGLRLGIGLPLGKYSETSNDIGDDVPKLIPLTAELGLRLNRYVTLGLFGQQAFGLVNADRCPVGYSCSGSDLRYGLQLHIHFNRAGGADPWIGLGVGRESLTAKREKTGSSAETSLSGWEFLNLQAGVQFAVGSIFSIGPAATLSLAQYGSVTASSTGAPDRSADVTKPTFHQMVFLGLRGVVSP